MSSSSPSDFFLETSLLVQTQRLTLRSLIEDHFSQYCEIVCDPSIGDFDNEFPKSPGQAQDSFQESLSCPPLSPEVWNEYGVFDEESRLVGLVSHFDSEAIPGERKSRVGYHFHSRFQGRGYGTEAVGALVSLLLEHGVQSVEGIVHPENKPSVSLLKRLGFSLIGFDIAKNEILFQLSMKPSP